jgi:hypothetical protein
MRVILSLLFLSFAAPAAAWTFTPGLPCRLSHATPEVEVVLTYDPRGPLYTITLTRPEPWPEAPVFSLTYRGPFGRRIVTDRHQLSNGGRSLTVTDRGFGNVLEGLIQDNVFTAEAGDTMVSVPLAGAAGPTAAFAKCRPAAGA